MARKYPALVVLVFIIAGILAADSFRIRNYYFLFSMLVTTFSALLLYHYHNSKLTLFFLGLSILSFSGFRFALSHYDYGLNHISRFADGSTKFKIYGTISDWVDLKQERTEIKLDVDSVSSNHRFYPRGKIMVIVNTVTTRYQRNDKIILSGKIYPVHKRRFSTTFDYNRFLNQKEISGTVYKNTGLDILIDKGNKYSIFKLTAYIRNAIRETFYKNLSKESAALASGFLIGETRDIEPALYQKFKRSGTLHLLAVSGSNVVLVLGFFLYLLRPFKISRKKRSVVLIIIVFAFTLLSYNEPSVVRASTMAGLVLFAGILERKYSLINIISVAAFLILLYQPAQLFDIGFQLSFVIAWGLILIVPRFAKILERYNQKNWYKFLLLPFFISFAAQIYSFGLVALYFKQLPIFSPLANLIIVPLVSITVLGVLILIVAELLLPILGLFVGSILTVIFNITIIAVSFFGSEGVPLLHFETVSLLTVITYYVFVFIIPFSFSNKKYRRFLLVAGILIANIFIVFKLSNQVFLEEEIVIHAFTIPGGLAVAIVQPDNSSDLIITGVKAKTYAIENKIFIPELTKRNIQSINSMFLLNADYNAIDDILRAAESFGVEKIFVSKTLNMSMQDKLKEMNKPALSQTIKVLTSDMDSRNIGYRSLNNGIILELDNMIFYMSQKLSIKEIEKVQREKPVYLFLGSTWNISFEHWKLISNYSEVNVICSKTAQVNSEESLFLPDYPTNSLFDISVEGDYLLRIKK